jgi:UDP-N-acetylglucosamine 4,6-dehydratase
MTKALAEKHLLTIRNQTGRDILIFRWGNIIGSQGSVLSSFIKQLRSEKPIVSITHADMTRFWLKIEDAIDYVTFHTDRLDELKSTAEEGSYQPWDEEKKDIYIHPNIKAAYVKDLVQSIANVLGISSYGIKITGIRPGEKIHEHLKSDHDSCIRSDTAEKYTMDELTELVRPAVINYLSENNV